MEPTTTIRAELENFMKQNELNITQFGLVAGINPGENTTIYSHLWRCELGSGDERGCSTLEATVSRVGRG
ncbi:hypothetical protein BK134_02155 [Paenibacillus peoriae]|nr:hypothetical protein BK134_02155 [Paenibacillus peoriae]